jgi:hypothetical protein
MQLPETPETPRIEMVQEQEKEKKGGLGSKPGHTKSQVLQHVTKVSDSQVRCN